MPLCIINESVNSWLRSISLRTSTASSSLKLATINSVKTITSIVNLFLCFHLAPEGVGHHRSHHDLHVDELDEIIINDMGRSHSGGHAYGGGGDKNGTLLPNIGHHNGARASNSYPSVASKTNYGSHLGESLSRSPSAGLSGRVDWQSKYLK